MAERPKKKPVTKDPTAKKDLTQIGISSQGQSQLDAMRKTGLIVSDLDGYRLAVAVAIAFNRSPVESASGRTTKYAVNSVDPEQALRTIVVEVYPEFRSRPYRAIEDLAHQGLEILRMHSEGEEVWLGELVTKIEEANEVVS